MKLCTDACLFGALVSAQLANSGFSSALDIGTGTGVLPLMLAQQNSSLHIDAIEIDSDAASQSAENVQASPWAQQVRIIHADFMHLEATRKYDLVLSNPPFYENDLKSEKVKKNWAKHDTTLNLESLINRSASLVTENGWLALLLPLRREKEADELLIKYGFVPYKKWTVRQSIEHGVFRIIYIAGKQLETQLEKTEMSIRNTDGTYTKEFGSLLADYYLHL